MRLRSPPGGHAELRRKIPTASQKVLVDALRELEGYGVVKRKIFPEIPPRVEYSLTRLGLSLEPIVHSLCEWGKTHATAIRDV